MNNAENTNIIKNIFDGLYNLIEIFGKQEVITQIILALMFFVLVTVFSLFIYKFLKSISNKAKEFFSPLINFFSKGEKVLDKIDDNNETKELNKYLILTIIKGIKGDIKGNEERIEKIEKEVFNKT